ncbi:MAG: glycosyltransferase family 2 protein, partial [Aquincola sp.]|nr:glycosyltransferase family 2 protein [Aquincola sp.]
MPQVPEPTPPLSALALGMVKNEADIVEAFVRHNLHFVDLMVLLDNGSTDGTRDILEALQKEGLPLLV